MKVYPLHCEHCGGEMTLWGQRAAMTHQPAYLIYRCVLCRRVRSVLLTGQKETRTWRS